MYGDACTCMDPADIIHVACEGSCELTWILKGFEKGLVLRDLVGWKGNIVLTTGGFINMSRIV